MMVKGDIVGGHATKKVERKRELGKDGIKKGDKVKHGMINKD